MSFLTFIRNFLFDVTTSLVCLWENVLMKYPLAKWSMKQWCVESKNITISCPTIGNLSQATADRPTDTINQIYNKKSCKLQGDKRFYQNSNKKHRDEYNRKHILPPDLRQHCRVLVFLSFTAKTFPSLTAKKLFLWEFQSSFLLSVCCAWF